MENEKAIKNYVLLKIKNIMKQPAKNLRYPFLVPGTGYTSELWGWDAYWEAVSLRRICEICKDDELTKAGISRKIIEEYMRGSVLNFIDAQEDDGYIPIMLASEGLFENFFHCEYVNGVQHNQHLPFLCQFTLLASEFSGRYDWFDGNKLLAYMRYFELHQYDKSSGLYFWQDDIMIGIDNNPTVFKRLPRSSADIFLNSFIYLEYEALAKLLEKLNDERVNDIRKKQEKLKAAVNIEMWDAHDGIYYSQDISMYKTDCSVKGVVLHSGMATHWHTVPLKIRFWGCFLPMYAGICTENQAERICNHLTENDDIFATYGIRTLARNEKMYSLEKSAGNPSNWLGAIWVIANYCVYKGLVRYNKIELANKLRSATLDLLSRSLTEYGDFFESYHPDTGAPFMHAGFLSHNLPIVDML